MAMDEGHHFEGYCRADGECFDGGYAPCGLYLIHNPSIAEWLEHVNWVCVLAQQEGFHHCWRLRRTGNPRKIYIFTNKVLIWQKTRKIWQNHLLVVLFPILCMSQYVTEYLVWGWRVSVWGLIWLCPVQNLVWKLYRAFSHLAYSCEDCIWNLCVTLLIFFTKTARSNARTRSTTTTSRCTLLRTPPKCHDSEQSIRRT